MSEKSFSSSYNPKALGRAARGIGKKSRLPFLSDHSTQEPLNGFEGEPWVVLVGLDRD